MEQLSGIAVYPVLYILYVLVCKFADMGAFWNPSADEFVCVLITATFTGVVRVTVVDFCTFHNLVVVAFLHCFHIKELYAIVAGD